MRYFSLALAITRQIARENLKNTRYLTQHGVIFKAFSCRQALAIEEELPSSINKMSFSKSHIEDLTNKSLDYTLKTDRNIEYSNSDQNDVPSTQNQIKSSGKVPLEKILFVKDQLIRHIPMFLKDTHPYRLYTADIIFENFYHEPGKTYIGATQYAIQLTLIRMKINWKFSHAKVDILKITHDENEATIKIRWRVSGVGGLKRMVKLWKFDVTDIKNTIKNESNWIDGFSIMYLNSNGYIYKHTLQRVMTQYEGDEKVKDKKLSNLAMSPTMFSNLKEKNSCFEC